MMACLILRFDESQQALSHPTFPQTGSADEVHIQSGVNGALFCPTLEQFGFPWAGTVAQGDLVRAADPNGHPTTFAGGWGSEGKGWKTKLTAKRQSRTARNSFSRRLSSTRLTPPTRANCGLVAKASQKAFDATVTLATMKRWTVSDETVKCGR